MILTKNLVWAALIALLNCAMAQQDSTWRQSPSITLSGFADVFYVYDFNEPTGGQRLPFFYNHNRHNEFNLNLGLVKLALDHLKYRAAFSLHAGTYVNDNYAAEPLTLRNVAEAHMGLGLNKKNTLWFDAGIFPSHIGFETAVSMDNLTLTRSILAENSPYFLSGAKIGYRNDRWEIAGLVLNGWQRIRRLPGNSMPSFGTQITYSREKIKLNWSTFAGTDDPDTTRRMRYFSNLYGQFQLSGKIIAIAGFDYGIQQQSINSAAYDYWLSPVLIVQYAFSENWKTALRAEYYEDKTGIIIPPVSPGGFAASGISWNLDYSPVPNLAARVEARWLNGSEPLFIKQAALVNTDFFVVASLAFRFAKEIR